MKVALYARVSTEEQDATKQLEAMRLYCNTNGHTIFKEYLDIISGTTISRPSFDQLLQDMRQYRFQGIMVTKLDRIGRSLAHLLSLFNEFKLKGVHFIAITQNIDTTTAAGTLLFQIMGAFAEFERNIISERTKEGLRRATGVGKRGKDKRPRKRRGTLRKNIWDIR